MKKASHEDLFIQSYSRLQGFALQITEKDHALAEDLLHDAFIHFTRSQPELEKIENLDGYLYGIMRNLHLSNVRKRVRRDRRELSIIDYETLRLGLKNLNPQQSLQIEEELKRICCYVCLRKESARAASVMILRFFHGYFPSEIAEVLRTTQQAVKVRLQAARAEARAVLDNPAALKMMKDKLSGDLILNKSFRDRADLVKALGEMIFRSNSGRCFEDWEIEVLYRKNPSEPIETRTLAHFVSCAKCLDKINILLNLLPMSERYSVDYLGRDNNDHPGPGAGGGKMDEEKRINSRQALKRAAEEVFEHEPQLLFVSVNGKDAVCKQQIENDLNRWQISLPAEEEVQFIEIFSEQDVRLLFLPVGEDFACAGEQSCFVKLSGERELKLKMTDAALGVKIEVDYFDPHFAENRALLAKELEALNTSDFLRSLEPETALFRSFSARGAKSSRLSEFFGSLKAAFMPSERGLPFAATAALTIVLLAAFLLGKFFIFAPQVSAREMLARAAVSEREQTNEAHLGNVLHRTMSFEEINAAGELLRQNKIEIWQDRARNLTVRRLFNEKNELLAGEWRRSDGVSTYYQPESLPVVRLAPSDKELIAAGKYENLWLLSVSAAGFESLLETPEKAELKRESDNFLISYQSESGEGVIQTVLTLNKDLRASGQTILLGKNTERREFRFLETDFEKKKNDAVSRAIFEPEKELVKQSQTTAAKTVEAKPAQTQPASENAPRIDESAASPSEKPAAPTSAATQELEVRVLEILSSVNALSGDQINIFKTSEGKLRITGIVDAARRRDEILAALAPVRANPAIQVNILTPEEARQAKSPKQSAPGAPPEIENVTVEARRTTPASEALRDYFASRNVSEDAIENEIRRYSSSVLGKSSQIRRAALSMKQIADRFSAADPEKMDAATREQWRRLLKQNAGNLMQHAENLRGELRSVFGTGGGGGGSAAISDDASLIRAARRLFELSLGVDRDVRSSFSLASGGTAAVKSGKFENSLAEIINLSRGLK